MSEPLPKPNRWFNYPIRVQPHHTDYGGVVWHGSYITWMESARVECLRAAGLSFEQFVQLGYDLPVVALDIRYRQPLRLGVEAMVKTQLEPV
ncbi:MAG: acyl-CoA thioesterase [Phormidesmis sp.]